jgi:hypothetical protein
VRLFSLSRYSGRGLCLEPKVIFSFRQNPHPNPLPEYRERGESHRVLVWFLLVLSALGLATRFVLAKVTWGTNDADTWIQFGYYVNRDGILLQYQSSEYLNHPPLPIYWALMVYRTAQSPPWDWEAEWAKPPDFPFLFKFPAMLSDCVTAWLLWKIWRPKAGPVVAAAVAAGFAWSLCSILVSGYHCNTDPVYAMLSLLCVYLVHDRGRHFLGGLALAAAINVKLTPVLLIPPLLLSYRDWRDLLRFVAGLSIGVLPFLPVLYHVGEPFYRNAVQYKSNPDNWGITWLLMYLQGGPPVDFQNVSFGQRPISDFYFNNGRYVVLALVGAWAMAARLLGRWNRYQIAAVTYAIFLVFSSGFGVQYTAIILPLLFAAAPAFAAWYGLVAGGFLLMVYWAQWPGKAWPPNSQFGGRFPMPSPLWGLAAWLMLGWYLVRTTLRNVTLRRREARGFPVELSDGEAAG